MPNTRDMTQHAHRARRALVGACVVASMITVPAMHAAADPAQPALHLHRGGHGHIDPVKGGARHAPAPATAPKATAPTTRSGQWEYPPVLQNFGGPLISHVKIVQVLWGAENAGAGEVYLPQVKGSVTPNLGSFFSQVTASPYMDWLHEYDANSQTINRGTFVGRYTITPNGANDGSTIDDTNIQAELLSQINNSHLPAPDADTLYMLYFPANKVITLTVDSTVYNSIDDFCAYHSAFTTSGPNVRYGVLPDGAQRPGACGTDVAWRNMTSASSHEMIEAITDPDGSLATGSAYPLGWYDDNLIPFTFSQWGEIGDICNQDQSRIIGADTNVYTVQRMWSNRSQRCVTMRTISVGDGSVLEGNAGQRSVRIPITLSDPSKSDVTVQYTVAGVTATPGPPGPGNDYGVVNGSTGTITFSAASGQTPVRSAVVINVYGDTAVESNETFTVTLSNPTNGYSLGRSVGTGTILDDDATPPPPGKPRAVGVGDSLVTYGSYGTRQFVFPVTLSQPLAYPVVIHFTLHDGTATFGPYYMGVAGKTDGVVVIPAGQTTAFINVDVRASHMATQTKTMTVSLEALGGPFALPGWLAITRSIGTGTIVVGP